jgi:ferredoxin-NADP reductase
MNVTALTAREEIAARTMAFHLSKPAGFAFKAGQAIELLLPSDAAGEAAPRHAFSIVSAPYENELVVATRMRDSAYKRALGLLPIGAAVQIDGPFGSLTLHKDSTRAAVFIAGGIGITPFVSILRQAAHDASEQRLVLLYSNRRPEDAAFLRDLQRLEDRNPNFTLVATMTGMATSRQRWDGQTARLGPDLLRSVMGPLTRPIAYVAGPPAMVQAVRGALNDTGVQDDDIRGEEFFGY